MDNPLVTVYAWPSVWSCDTECEPLSAEHCVGPDWTTTHRAHAAVAVGNVSTLAAMRVKETNFVEEQCPA
jgi:hypothetical protein